MFLREVVVLVIDDESEKRIGFGVASHLMRCSFRLYRSRWLFPPGMVNEAEVRALTSAKDDTCGPLSTVNTNRYICFNTTSPTKTVKNNVMGLGLMLMGFPPLRGEN